VIGLAAFAYLFKRHPEDRQRARALGSPIHARFWYEWESVRVGRRDLVRGDFHFWQFRRFWQFRLILFLVFLRNVILRKLPGSHFALVGIAGILHAAYRFGFHVLPFFQQLFHALGIVKLSA
jgi:hypothetical protein